MDSSSSIRSIFVFTIGIFTAIWLGVSLVTDQFDTLLKFSAAGLLLFCALLGRRIWLLMIAFSSMGIPLIRGFSTHELGQVLFLSFGILMLLMRRLPIRFTMGEVEWWRLAVALIIVQVYMRNPVGLSMAGAGSVGGKAYFLAALAFMASCLYGALRIEPREIKWAYYITLFCSFLGIPLYEARLRFGGADPGASQLNTQQGPVDEGEATRVGFLGGIGVHLSRWIISRVHPLKACFHPLWAPLILISLAAAAGSGFRNTIAIVGMYYILGLAYRGGLASVFTASILGAFGIVALAIVNLFAPLPPNVQRSLTPFPGTWEQRYKDDAKNSNEWRLEMWKEALLTDRWIANKWLGDGLGISATELARSQELTSRKAHLGTSGLTLHQENILASGDYHSGPVQTIRTVGYLGLIVILLAMTRLAILAHRQICRCRHTEWFPIALYFFIPVIASPFIFVFIFGEFGAAVVGLFVSGAFLTLFKNNVPLPHYVIPKRGPYILITARNRNAVGRRL